MKSIGIICEYNPFHNGHLYHLNKAKELFPDYKVILVLDGCFTQRGDASIINKWDKTDIALEMGVDLVIELPFVFATQSADIFAKASIEILNEMNVDYLVFGSEQGEVQPLIDVAKSQLDPKYDKLIQKYIKDGISYPKAASKAIFDLTRLNISKPNDILGISYIREILKLDSSIKPYTIKRTNDYNDNELYENVTSATSIRTAIKDNIKITNQVPEYVLRFLENNNPFIDDYFDLLKYKIISDSKKLDIYNTVDEGIENRLNKFILKSYDLKDFILKVKTKRYTYNKLNRMLTHILCSFTKEEASKFGKIEYLRVLGFNSNGQEYLKYIKDFTELPIISSYSDLNNEMLSIEYRSTCIYSCIFDNQYKKQILDQEYRSMPIIK